MALITPYSRLTFDVNMHVKAGLFNAPITWAAPQLRPRNDGARGDEPHPVTAMYGLGNFDRVFSNTDWLEDIPRVRKLYITTQIHSKGLATALCRADKNVHEQRVDYFWQLHHAVSKHTGQGTPTQIKSFRAS
jgi:hypothetical protein